MKVRPLLILLLFVVSAFILVWIFFAAMHERRTPRKAAWAETLADLDACSRQKHVKSVQYDHFADIAAKEHRHDAARLFRAMAFSERLQEYNCANVIVRFGGSYTPPTKVSVFQGTTVTNLTRSIAYERHSLENPGDDIRRALEKGNRYAARMLVWANAGDVHHMALMEACLLRIGEGNLPAITQAEGAYMVCPVCGNIYNAGYCAPYCPFCLTDSRRFIRFD